MFYVIVGAIWLFFMEYNHKKEHTALKEEIERLNEIIRLKEEREELGADNERS